MTVPQAILAGFALVATAIFMTNSPVVMAQQPGSFMVVPTSQSNSAFRLNTQSGAISYCIGQGSPGYGPYVQCSVWN